MPEIQTLPVIIILELLKRLWKNVELVAFECNRAYIVFRFDAFLPKKLKELLFAVYFAIIIEDSTLLPVELQKLKKLIKRLLTSPLCWEGVILYGFVFKVIEYPLLWLS